MKRAKEQGQQLPVPVPEGHKKTLEDVVKEAFTLIERAKDIKDLEYERLMLESILNDYVDTKNGIKERKKKGEGRIVNPSDPDVRWGAKSDSET